MRRNGDEKTGERPPGATQTPPRPPPSERPPHAHNPAERTHRAVRRTVFQFTPQSDPHVRPWTRESTGEGTSDRGPVSPRARARQTVDP